MIEIYNSKEWSALFGGSPNWIIADDGYIYEASEYNNLMPRPCGRIDMGRGMIYGKDYGSVNPRPIAYIQERNGVKEIYEKRPDASWGEVPFLYLYGDTVYSREQFLAKFGDGPGPRPKPSEPGPKPPEPGPKPTEPGPKPTEPRSRGGGIPMPSGGGGGGGGWGCFLFIVAFLALGKIFDEMGEILSSPTRLLSYCAIYIGLVLYGILLAKLFFGVASLIRGEGFMKGFNIKIIKELKEKFVWGTKKSKPKATVRTQSRSNTSEYSGPTTYQHTCVNCGKKFSDQTAHNPYCEACRKEADPLQEEEDAEWEPVLDPDESYYTRYLRFNAQLYPKSDKDSWEKIEWDIWSSNNCEFSIDFRDDVLEKLFPAEYARYQREYAKAQKPSEQMAAIGRLGCLTSFDVTLTPEQLEKLDRLLEAFTNCEADVINPMEPVWEMELNYPNHDVKHQIRGDINDGTEVLMELKDLLLEIFTEHFRERYPWIHNIDLNH